MNIQGETIRSAISSANRTTLYRGAKLSSWGLITLLAVISAGCQTVPHEQKRIDAQRRWGQVRSGLKYQLAQQHYDHGRVEEAIRMTSEAIDIDPTSQSAHLLLAQALFELGKVGSCQQSIDRARRAGMDMAPLHYLQGVIHEQEGHHEEALKSYQQACQRDPDSSDYLIAEIETLVALNRTEEALSLLNERTDHPADDSTLTALQAHLQALLGNPEEALRFYYEATISKNESLLLTTELGILLARAGRYEQAITVLAPLIKSSAPEDVSNEVYEAVGMGYMVLNQPGKTQQVLSGIAELRVDQVAIQKLLAKAALLQNDWPTALTAIGRVQQINPDDVESLLIRAVVHWKRGRYESAAKDLKRLLTLNPNDADARCLLAEVMLARGNPQQAEASFQAALEHDPENPWAMAGLDALTVQSIDDNPPRNLPEMTHSNTQAAVAPSR